MKLSRAVSVTLVVAVGVAMWSGLRYWDAATDPGVSLAGNRDAVLSTAASEVATVHTIDYRSPAAALDRWAKATTGDLRNNLTGDRQGQADRATQTKTIATAQILHSALVSFDDAKGTARAIVVLRVDLSTAGDPAAAQTRTVDADLSRTASGWQLSAAREAT